MSFFASFGRAWAADHDKLRFSLNKCFCPVENMKYPKMIFLDKEKKRKKTRCIFLWPGVWSVEWDKIFVSIAYVEKLDRFTKSTYKHRTWRDSERHHISRRCVFSKKRLLPNISYFSARKKHLLKRKSSFSWSVAQALFIWCEKIQKKFFTETLNCLHLTNFHLFSFEVVKKWLKSRQREVWKQQ